MLLDLLEVCPPLMQFQVLGCLADLMENRKVRWELEGEKEERRDGWRDAHLCIDISNSQRMVQWYYLSRCFSASRIRCYFFWRSCSSHLILSCSNFIHSSTFHPSRLVCSMHSFVDFELDSWFGLARSSWQYTLWRNLYIALVQGRSQVGGHHGTRGSYCRHSSTSCHA